MVAAALMILSGFVLINVGLYLRYRHNTEKEQTRVSRQQLYDDSYIPH